jgi:hypothetical protein
MKIIISESQSDSILHNMLDEIFDGHIMKFEKDSRNFYVGDKLLMILSPTTATLDKTILKKLTENLFFESMKDLRDGVRDWINDNFGVRKTAEKFMGVNFFNLIGADEPPKERKKPVREKLPPKEKKSPEQIKKERQGYSKFLKYQKEFDKNK